MSCVVVGSGIAGLAVAYYLQKLGIKVSVYSSPIRKPASSIFTGILYRYPGRWGKKSKYADEAYLESLSLIKNVEQQTKRKIIISKGVIKKFSPRLKKFSDVIMQDGDGYIDDSVTIDMQQYLLGLKSIIGYENFVEKDIENINAISGIKVIAAGYGVKELLNLPGLMYRKGQQFKGRKKVSKPKVGTIVGRGHISFLGGDQICLGSTYEKEFSSDKVDEQYAEKEIIKKMEPWFGPLENIQEKEFTAGVRVGQDTTYLPLVKQLDKTTYLFTGLGSRGLLYHAYYGKILADKIGL